MTTFTGVKSSLKRVSIDNIQEDIQRQEGMDLRRVESIGANFNPLALSTITVSERDSGEMFVLDGRHRCFGAKRAGYKGAVPAVVVTGLTRQQEAELFILLNDSKAVSRLSKFVAAVLAGRPDAVAINNIIEAYSWKVSLAPEPGCVAAIGAVERIYHHAANASGSDAKGPYPELLGRVLRTVTEAWEWDRKSADAMMLLGVAQLYARFGAQVDDARLIAEMQDTRPGILLGQAKALRSVQGGTVPSAMAKVLVGMHNKRRRTNLLPEWVWTR